MDHSISKHVGLDVHKDTIAVAVADAGGGEVRSYGEIANRPAAVVRLAKKLAAGDQQLRFYYEAGPCGYELFRQLLDLGHDCQVVAPSLIPRRAGDRVKTDRRDALNLARLGRAGELTAVWVPDEGHEAMRDLMRCREDAMLAERQVRQQLSGFLLRHGRRYTVGRQRWTRTHMRWLETLTFEQPVQQAVFRDYLDSVKHATARLAALDEQIAEALATWSQRPMVEALMALRGVSIITAMTVLTELGDLSRFATAPQLMAFLGLVPSEHSTGQTRHRGSITKAGNGHVRRVLIESSWSYRHPARMTHHMKRKVARATEAVQSISWKAQLRLCGRYRRLMQRGMMPAKVTTAVARELAGFIWAVHRQMMNAGADGPRPETGTS